MTSAENTTPNRWAWLNDLRSALRQFVLVRVPWIFLVTAAMGTVPMGGGANGMTSEPAPSWARAWLRWDSGWYTRIMEQGYSASGCGQPGRPCTQASISFLPAYPMAIKQLTRTGASIAVTSFVFNALCLIVALWGLRRLAATTIGAEFAESSALAMLLFPTTLYFTAGYAEALFAATSIWATVFAREQRGFSAGVLLAIAALTRPHGIVLAACLVGGAFIRRRWRSAFVMGLLVAVPFAAFLLWQHDAFGDPIAFLHARQAWVQPGTPLQSITAYWGRVSSGEIVLLGGADFLAVPLLLVAGLWACRRMSMEAGIFCLLLALLPASQGQVWGLSRAALGAFPVFLMLGSVRAPLRLPLAIFGATLAAIDAFYFINGHPVA